MSPQVCTLPYTYGRTAEKSAVSLAPDGVVCVPVLEASQLAKSKSNVAAHRHPRKALPMQKRVRIDALVDEIREHPEQNFALEELTRRACVSESLLLTLFKDRTGLPPHAFLIQCRLAAALELIRNTDQPIAAIAKRYSFATPQHFANIFKRRYGITAVAARNGAMPIA